MKFFHASSDDADQSHIILEGRVSKKRLVSVTLALWDGVDAVRLIYRRQEEEGRETAVMSTSLF